MRQLTDDEVADPGDLRLPDEHPGAKHVIVATAAGAGSMTLWLSAYSSEQPELRWLDLRPTRHCWRPTCAG